MAAYATSVELLARSATLASQDPIELDNALEAASRSIDGYCSRRFWLDPVATPTIRVFQPRDLYLLDLGQFEIGASTPVTIKTDDGTGTFATTVASTAYQLEPVNAPYDAKAAGPYTHVRAVSTSWPLTYSTSGRQDRVQITARFGWPAVPAVVREACLIMAADTFENPTGVRSESIDGYSVSYGAAAAVRSKLANFRRMWAA